MSTQEQIPVKHFKIQQFLKDYEIENAFCKMVAFCLGHNVLNALPYIREYMQRRVRANYEMHSNNSPIWCVVYHNYLIIRRLACTDKCCVYNKETNLPLCPEIICTLSIIFCCGVNTLHEEIYMWEDVTLEWTSLYELLQIYKKTKFQVRAFLTRNCKMM